jgi:urea carboxylase
MIFDEPRIKPLGDAYLSVEFGDDASLESSFTGLALKKAIEQLELPGVTELYVTGPQISVVFDRERIKFGDIEKEVRRLLPEIDRTAPLTSRLFTMPIWYDDPWSVEVAAQYNVPNNLEYVAELNGMTRDELIAFHSSTDYWVVIVAFVPGVNLHYPLDFRPRLSAPKYYIPRSFTHARSVSLAGVGTCHYSMASPGGYQMLGRLAVDIYQPEPKFDIFMDNGVLLKPGDRIRYRPVGALEYEEIWHSVQQGTYEYEVVEDTFDVAGYLAEAKAAASNGNGTA